MYRAIRDVATIHCVDTARTHIWRSSLRDVKEQIDRYGNSFKKYTISQTKRIAPLVSRTPFSVTVLLLCHLHLSFPLLSLGATSRKEKEKKNGRAKKEVIQTKKLTSAAGFEPTRAEHNGLAVHLLNHSDKQTSFSWSYLGIWTRVQC